MASNLLADSDGLQPTSDGLHKTALRCSVSWCRFAVSIIFVPGIVSASGEDYSSSFVMTGSGTNFFATVNTSRSLAALQPSSTTFEQSSALPPSILRIVQLRL